MPSLKLLVVFDNLELSGTHRAALNLMDGLSAAGVACRALICMRDKTGLTHNDDRFVWPSRTPDEGLGAKLGKAWVALRTATRLAAQADVILGTCPPSSLIAAWAGRRGGRPAIGWVHYDVRGRRREHLGATGGVLRDSVQNLLYFHGMPRLQHLVFVSESTRSAMAAPLRRPMPPDWVVLPNVYRRAAFAETSSSVERVADLRRYGEPLLLVLGRLVRQKRWDHAFATAAELHRLGVPARWVFVGDGPERDAFHQALQSSPVRDRLHWLGADPNPLPLLAQCEALVMTSLYEAWPTVILEAFDLGVPVLSYDCPSGPAEMLGHGERGWVTAEEPAALARALAERLGPQGADEARRRSEAARRFLQRLGTEQVVGQWLDHLQHVRGASGQKA